MNQVQLQAYVDRQIGKHVKNIVVHLQSADESLNLIASAGVAHPHDQSPMMPDTPYFVASISKTYTAAIIMKLHEAGTLNLDASISDYLPESVWQGIHVHKGRDHSQHLKVYHLMNQTSGLPDYFEDKPKGGRSLYDELKAGMTDRAYNTEELMAIVRCLSPRFAPGANEGKRAHYADTNYHLLGAIIEAVTGKPYADSLQEMICQPLGLTETYAFDAVRAESRRRPAMIYFKDRPLDLPLFISSHAAEGGIVSTTAENLIFLRAFFDGKLFDKAHFDRMMGHWNAIFFPLEYAYGLMRFKLPRILSPFQAAPEFIGHSGSTGSFAFYMPSRGLYFAGTVNQAATPGRPFRLMLQLANKV